MTINEAIKILNRVADDPGSCDIHDVIEAELLGIEALKWINQWRGINSPLSNVRLPGETE